MSKYGYGFLVERAVWEDADRWATALPEYAAYARESYANQGVDLAGDPCDVSEVGEVADESLVCVRLTWRVDA